MTAQLNSTKVEIHSAYLLLIEQNVTKREIYHHLHDLFLSPSVDGR